MELVLHIGYKRILRMLWVPGRRVASSGCGGKGFMQRLWSVLVWKDGWDAHELGKGISCRRHSRNKGKEAGIAWTRYSKEMVQVMESENRGLETLRTINLWSPKNLPFVSFFPFLHLERRDPEPVVFLQCCGLHSCPLVSWSLTVLWNHPRCPTPCAVNSCMRTASSLQY